MKQLYQELQMNPIFRGITGEEFIKMLPCVGGEVKKYRKGDNLIQMGEPISQIGIVVSGHIQVVREDVGGNQNLMAELGKGDIFGETFACAGVKESPVIVTALEDTGIFYLNYGKMIRICSSACPFHTRLVENLLSLMAAKNLYLNEKIEILSKRTTRERLMLYFNRLGKGNSCMTIPFNREKLAAYLCVERSALCAELSRMQKDGLIRYKGNWIEMLQTPAVIF